MKIIGEGLTMMGAAFSLVAALAWNEAIKKLIDEFIPKGKGVLSLFIYAGIVTVIAVIITSRLSSLKEKIGEEEGK
ncbi:MAG: hypothetical protein A3C85_02350 [Candidatus Doudnabacteria bacterium RIFCSPHIGHO2_02_FULL_48_21]|uniref:Uncharacterized protein n=1 Tax=Candidatus Doudnabacteria bacterium RIFCSPLOWO2_02_FULL_48_13 TaxID=1817845 RepID=A0A1F5QC36_9BACT|nr:MAG: hypothetical protein A3K05_04550 [Candidatus Doudnabacteria bacterium RIFCSPHIGHO2_01_48_18]OGE79947.1 MAG: hypothetical protein A2668_01930 [Candidatus Doudnabacteria bacterium RIFCSPHIGHO2_01_FULL_48_180]OGE90964.1 MAG: hypothetical protein A3F44_02605 [Candidatus Doudnabacteria bacterium RIFCSPHIGHO2_12_FULL_47_25]OGE93463.1 MAG: hypothetical protein A3C85_02350 [Candidatus Doudnabacteria bacterium RIFCSPHIGHO2_02_FULL_48_21]OGE96298.1 MAG: hypothetical protein A3A83_04750 [Candidatu